MTIKLENPLRLKVALDAPELLEYGLTFDQLDYHQSKTKQLLNALLIKATRTTDFKLHPGRMMIEAFPAENGGCIIYFTIDQARHRVFRRRENSCCVFVFSRLQHLLDAAVAAYISGAEHSDSRLYKRDAQWRLAVLGPSNKITSLLNEFADACSPKRAFFNETDEHSQLICSNAINQLGAAFCKR